MKVLGIILIVLGILAFFYTGFTYTTEETIADIGPLELKADKEHTIGWPPILGVILVIGGIVMVVADRKNR